LPDIARDLLAHNIYYANFIYFMPHYDWSAMVNNSIRPKYTDAAPYLREAVDILEGNGIAVGVRYAPQCTIAGLEKNHAGITSVYYDPHEWMNAVEHSGEGDAFREGNWRSMKPGDPSPGAWLLQEKIGGPIIARGSPAGISKVFMDQCHECSAQKVCDGVDQSYIDTYGPGEFVPYINDPRGEILDRDRQRYFAGHVVKRLPFADVKSVTKRILKPEPISERPMVSVFIANYNYADWVGKAIKSVLDQTYRNIELIVVDDASTDTSRQEILKALDLESLDVEGFTFGGDVLGRRQFIWRQTNSGGNPATCHNDALYRSRGELVCYLDSDDWFEPSYIEEAVACLKQNPWASYVYPGLSTFGTVEEQWPATPFDPHQEIMGNFIPYCVVARRSMYDDLEGYHEGCRGADDWYNWVKAIRLGHFGVPLPRQLMHYNRKDDGIFVAEVKPNYRKKQLHVYLDNYEAYQAEVIHWARAEAKKDGP
jgi:glycosyltransferase involved in cell wall biosynthesis